MIGRRFTHLWQAQQVRPSEGDGHCTGVGYRLDYSISAVYEPYEVSDDVQHFRQYGKMKVIDYLATFHYNKTMGMELIMTICISLLLKTGTTTQQQESTWREPQLCIFRASIEAWLTICFSRGDGVVVSYHYIIASNRGPIYIEVMIISLAIRGFRNVTIMTFRGVDVPAWKPWGEGDYIYFASRAGTPFSFSYRLRQDL